MFQPPPPPIPQRPAAAMAPAPKTTTATASTDTNIFKKMSELIYGNSCYYNVLFQIVSCYKDVRGDVVLRVWDGTRQEKEYVTCQRLSKVQACLFGLVFYGLICPWNILPLVGVNFSFCWTTSITVIFLDKAYNVYDNALIHLPKSSFNGFLNVDYCIKITNGALTRSPHRGEGKGPSLLHAGGTNQALLDGGSNIHPPYASHLLPIRIYGDQQRENSINAQKKLYDVKCYDQHGLLAAKLSAGDYIALFNVHFFIPKFCFLPSLIMHSGRGKFVKSTSGILAAGRRIVKITKETASQYFDIIDQSIKENERILLLNDDSFYDDTVFDDLLKDTVAGPSTINGIVDTVADPSTHSSTIKGSADTVAHPSTNGNRVDTVAGQSTTNEIIKPKEENKLAEAPSTTSTSAINDQVDTVAATDNAEIINSKENGAPSTADNPLDTVADRSITDEIINSSPKHENEAAQIPSTTSPSEINDQVDTVADQSTTDDVEIIYSKKAPQTPSISALTKPGGNRRRPSSIAFLQSQHRPSKRICIREISSSSSSRPTSNNKEEQEGYPTQALFDKLKSIENNIITQKEDIINNSQQDYSTSFEEDKNLKGISETQFSDMWNEVEHAELQPSLPQSL